MLITETDASWCENHAHQDENGDWVCKKTNTNIVSRVILRSLRDGKFPLSGSGKVVEVTHLYCPGCNPDWKAPESGAPIDPSEILQI